MKPTLPEGSAPLEVIDEAVRILMRTNRCDGATARAILATTASRNRLDERDVAVTLVALSRTPRRARRLSGR